MSSPCVSVVITTHFRDDMLTECLASLTAQTLPLHEVVVVDDGGTGSARELVERCGPRFRYLLQSNGGQQNARNHGARASTGEWIAFLDDDDLWLPERHALVADLMATGQVDLISGDFTKFGDGWLAANGVFDEISRQSPGFWDGIARQSGSTHSIVGSFPTTRLVPVYPFWPSTLVIRRDLFERLNGWNERLRGIKSEDNEFGFRAIKSGQLGIIWPSTVRYRCHPGNESNSNLLNALGRAQVWEAMLLNPELTDPERSALINAIDRIQHEIVWSAFEKKDFQTVIKTSEKIGPCNLCVSEKFKILISRLLTGIKTVNNL